MISFGINKIKRRSCKTTKFSTIKLNLIGFVFLLVCIISTQSQINTHQTIKSSYPKIFTVDLNQHDQVKIRVFNTTAQVIIRYEVQSEQFKTGIRKYCYAGSEVVFEFTSQWKVKGLIMIEVEAYEFSYKITINDKVFKKEQNIVRDFLFDGFVYYKALKPKSYHFIASYQSKTFPNITLKFQNQNFIIYANQSKNISITLNQTLPYYQIFYTFENLIQTNNSNVQETLFELKLQLPNEMLKGCDGTNVYDSRIRACPSKSTQEIDSLKLHKFGQYSSFQVIEKSKIFIKITIRQVLRWKQFLSGLPLTLFVANSSNPHIFKNITATQLKSQYQTRQQCEVKNSVCNFILNLDLGNYTVMPVILRTQESFVYLFQRSDGYKIIQNFYSVLPSINGEDNCYYQLGGIVEFVSHQDKLTEFSFESQDKFFLAEYAVFGRSKVRNVQGQYALELIETIIGKVYNQNPNKASIYLELQPNAYYIIVFAVVSQEKFKKQKEKLELHGLKIEQNQEQQLTEEQTQQLDDDKMDKLFDEQDFDDQDDGNREIADDNDHIQDNQPPLIDTYQITLETETLQISVKNGKFPHKKIQEINIDNTTNNKNQSTTSESIFSSVVSQTIVIVIGVVGGVIILIGVLVFLWRRFRNRINSKDTQAKELVEEDQSNTVNAQSNTAQPNQNIEMTIMTDPSQNNNTNKEIRNQLIQV